jgi:hypothetical protein
MEREKTKLNNVTISMGKYGVILTIAIIAIRAFQFGAEPMSQWSVWSWFLMTLPVTLPMICFLSVGTVALILWIIYTVFSKKRF